MTADKISVRARKRDEYIEFRIVDEYADASFTEYVCQPQTSRHPLTLQALVALIDGSCEGDGPAFTWLTHNIVNGGCDPAEMYAFVSVSSEFYPDLGRYYRYRLEACLDELCVESAVRPERRE